MKKYYYPIEDVNVTTIQAVGETDLQSEILAASMPDDYGEGFRIIPDEDDVDTLCWEGEESVEAPSVTVNGTPVQPVEFTGGRPPKRPW